MKSSLTQIAWYLERDEARIVHYYADGGQRIECPTALGTLTYEIPGYMIDALNAERDRAYKTIAAKRRASR